MERLAKQLVAHPLYAGRVRLGRCAWECFADATPSIQIDPEDCMAMDTEEHDVAFLASFAEPKLIFEQLALLYAMPRMRARNFRVIVPYFSTGTMERVERPGQVATAATMARILSAVPSCPTGPSTIVIYDIHALQVARLRVRGRVRANPNPNSNPHPHPTAQEQFYFSDAVLVQLKSAVYLLKQVMAARDDRGSISVAFPDDGAAKRFKHLVKDYPHIVCIKVRDGDSRKVVVKDGEAAGRHCVILDDLVQTGGTLIECAKALKEAGAGLV